MALISDLPIDVLASILGRLCLRDYIRCRAVCSQWNFVVSLNPNPPQVPWLLLTRTEADEANEICRFYDFYHGVELTVAIPGVRWRRCIGSSNGWLMILDDFSELSMFNPLTGVRIALPSITTFPEVEPVFDYSGRVSHYSINNPHSSVMDRITVDQTCGFYYSKAIVKWTSDSMYTAVVIGAFPQSLAVARPGDEAWTLVKMGKNSFFFEDVIFYEDQDQEEGRFYTAAAGNWTVESVDLNDPFSIVSTVAVNGPVNVSSNRRDMQEPPHAWKRRYLIEISGNLFGVLRVDDLSIEKNDWRPTSFRVYMIDRDADKWVAVKSLGNYALFLGDNHFITVSKRDFPALKENSIYFTDDFWEGILVYKDKTRVFSLEDGSVEPSFYPKGTHQARPQPSWFVPNLSRNV